jgi:hypothetical protein
MIAPERSVRVRIGSGLPQSSDLDSAHWHFVFVPIADPCTATNDSPSLANDLLDHLVCERKQCWRYSEAEHLRSLCIDD